MLSGDTFSGEEALRMGLVDVCVEREALLEEAKTVARSMGSNPAWQRGRSWRQIRHCTPTTSRRCAALLVRQIDLAGR